MSSELDAGQLILIRHGESTAHTDGILTGLSKAEVQELNLPTGQPLAYDIRSDGSPVDRGIRCLDPDAAHAAAKVTSHEGGT